MTELATQELARARAPRPSLGAQAAQVSALLREAYYRKDWLALGYASWDEYLFGEFGEDGLAFGRAAIPTAPGADQRSVYFIQPTGGGLIKIGVAGDPRSRLASIQLMCPVRLRLLAVIPLVGQPGESELHKRFALSRVHGEWFEPDADLLAYIRENGVRP